MKATLLYLLFGLIGISVSQQICPPPQVLYPCQCRETIEDPITTRITCEYIEGNFDLKGILDNASAYVNDDIIFHVLTISRTGLVEIEEEAILNLRFLTIYITDNPELVKISSRAMDRSRDTTAYLHLYDNNLQNDTELFELVRSFKNLRFAGLNRNLITSIPDRAFQNLTHLEEVTLVQNRISGIGSQAFAGAPLLTRISLQSNLIPGEGLPHDAFDGVLSSAQVHLGNNLMDFMEQKSYQGLLDQAARVSVGVVGGIAERYYCDERADWICENQSKYEGKLTGFRCRPDEMGYADIWEYCAGGRNASLRKFLKK